MEWKEIPLKVWYECPVCSYEISINHVPDKNSFPPVCPHCMTPIDIPKLQQDE